MKTCLVLGGEQYQEYARYLGYGITTNPGDLSDVDLLFFTGGADVSPQLYNERPHPYTGSSISRDEFELNLFSEAVRIGVPIFGICRGSQLLCVANGGRLIQDVKGHAGVFHWADTSIGQKIYVSSTHHQMVLPPQEATVLAWASPVLSTGHYQNGDQDNVPASTSPDFKEVEATWYPKTKSLGVQWHPEFMDFNSDAASIIKCNFIKLIT